MEAVDSICHTMQVSLISDLTSTLINGFQNFEIRIKIRKCNEDDVRIAGYDNLTSFQWWIQGAMWAIAPLC